MESQIHQFVGADVSVVIVNWNSGDDLSRCLSALSEQIAAPAKVIIVDNHSNDGSLDKALPKLTAAEVVRLNYNSGFARGNNIGIAAACTEFVALLNPDAFPEPEWLQRLLQAASKFGANTSYASLLLQVGEAEKLDGTGDVYHVSGLAWRRDHGAPESGMSNHQPLFSPCAAAALYPRQMFARLGGFDEDFFCYFEDIDLGFRMRLAGMDCHYVAGAKVHHVGYGSTGRRSAFSLYHGHRNLVWTFVKNMPPALLRKYLSLHLLMNIGSLIVFAFKGEGLPVAQGKLAALRGLKTMWRKRASAQQHYHGSDNALAGAMLRSLIPRRMRDV